MPAHRTRVFASSLIAVAVGATTFSLPAQASTEARTGKLTICVDGAHGNPSNVTIRRDGRAVQAFRLAGCSTRKLPVGSYRIKLTAPAGYHVFSVGGSSGTIDSGGGQISAAWRERAEDHGRKIRRKAFFDDQGSPSIGFGLRRVRH